MRFVIYKNDDDRYVGMLDVEYIEKKIYMDAKVDEIVEFDSWDDFRKYLIVKYGRGNVLIRQGDIFELVYDEPDVVVEFRVQTPIWKIGDRWCVSTGENKFMWLEVSGLNDKNAEDVFENLIKVVVGKSRIGDVVPFSFTIKKMGGEE